MMQGYIFGGDTGTSYEALQRKRQLAEQLLQGANATPRNVGEGLSAIGKALAYRNVSRKADAAAEERAQGLQDAFNNIMGGYGGYSGGSANYAQYTPPEPTPEEVLGLSMGEDASQPMNAPDSVSVGGNAYSMGTEVSDPWAGLEDVKAGIFKGESGGDYDALFGFSNRGGPFSNVKLTDMTVDQALNFAAPSGEYGQWVKGQIGRVATPMGAYQVVGTTLRAAKDGLGLKGNERMTADLQDRIGKWILDNQGTGAWEGYRGPAKPGSGVRTASYSGGGRPQMGNQQMMQIAALLSVPDLPPGQKAVLSAMLQQGMAANQPVKPNYSFVKGVGVVDMNNPDPSLMAGNYEARPDAKATEYGLTPQYGVDENGNPVLIQLSRDGRSIETPLPDGVTFQKEPIKIDAGTDWILLDPISRQPVGKVSKNLGEAEAEKVSGRVSGEAEAQAKLELPNVIAEAESMVSLLDSIIADPALPQITGMVQGRLPPLTQAGTNLNVKIEQVKGKAFLQAFETLKGGGQITEREGIAAQNAIARLNRAQSDDEYIKALNELKSIVEKGLMRARDKAGQPAQTPPPQAAAPQATSQPQSQNVGDFSQMSAQEIVDMDIMSLTPDQLDAWEKRMNELGLGQ